jgi:hypothetical protein
MTKAAKTYLLFNKISNTILLTIVFMLYIRSLNLYSTYLLLCILWPTFHISYLPTITIPLFSTEKSLCLILQHILIKNTLEFG